MHFNVEENSDYFDFILVSANVASINYCSLPTPHDPTRLRNGLRPSIMAEGKKEAERARPLKRSWDDCCSTDDSPALQENPAEGIHLVSADKRRKNNHDFDKNNRDPTGLVFDGADSNSYLEPTVAEIRECPTETTVLGSSNYCRRSEGNTVRSRVR